MNEVKAARTDAATLIVSAQVGAKQADAYEMAAQVFRRQVQGWPEQPDLHLVRAASGPQRQYLILLSAGSARRLQHLQTTPEYLDWARSAAALADWEDRRVTSGDHWLDAPAAPDATPPAPALWKQVVIGTAGVYPLILLFSALIRPFTLGWPSPLVTLLVAALSTLCLNVPVLPLLNRLLRGWLYPAPATRRPGPKAARPAPASSTAR